MDVAVMVFDLKGPGLVQIVPDVKDAAGNGREFHFQPNESTHRNRQLKHLCGHPWPFVDVAMGLRT